VKNMFKIPFLDISFYRVDFYYKNLYLLLFVIGFALLIHFIAVKRSEKRAIKFSNFETLEKLIGKGVARERDLLPLILRILILSMIIFSISDFKVMFEGYKSNMDFFLLIDTSSSMLNPDIPSTRLEAAKSAGLDLLEKTPDYTKIGIITFGGEANIENPLTTSKEKLRDTLNNITYSEKAGTAIGDAILLAGTELKDLKGNKGIILVTDGTNNVGITINESLKFIENKNITVFTIGVGRKTNETKIELPEEFKKINGTVTVTQPESYDENMLRYLANYTGGKFFEGNNETSLKKIYEDIALKKSIITIEPTFYLLALAAILLLVEWSLGATKYKTIP